VSAQLPNHLTVKGADPTTGDKVLIVEDEPTLETLEYNLTRQGYEVYTASTGHVHPLTIQAMAEWGIDISRQRSKSVDELRDAEFDLVITVCYHAARDCPLWLGPEQVKYLGFPDPAAAIGNEAERLEVFRQVRDGLRQEALHYPEMEDSAAKGGFYDTATGNL
jgi:arsenate reductase